MKGDSSMGAMKKGMKKGKGYRQAVAAMMKEHMMPEKHKAMHGKGPKMAKGM